MARFIRTGIIILLLALTVIPVQAFALCAPNMIPVFPTGPSAPPQDLTDFVCILTNFTGSLFPIIVGLTVLVFFWGLAQFIRSSGDEKKVAEGKKLMTWGVVGLFIMVSIWGILQIWSNSLFGGSQPIGLPQLPV